MFYIEEEKRGFNAEENLSVPGSYQIEIEPDEYKAITFVCSLEENIEEIEGKEAINKEIVRLANIIYDSHLMEKTNPHGDNKDEKILQKIELIKNFIISADNFVAYRPSFGLSTIIAGYPWFLDWGRDTLISFEGLLLKTKRYEIAKEVILTFNKDLWVRSWKYNNVEYHVYAYKDALHCFFDKLENDYDISFDEHLISDRLHDEIVKEISKAMLQ